MLCPKFISLSAPSLILAIAGMASAQTPIADYQMQHTYASSVGSIGPLTVVGTSDDVTFIDGVSVMGHSQTVLNFEPEPMGVADTGAGVQTQTSGYLVSPANYTAVLLADFNLSATDLVATKVMDFKNLSTDDGLYINDATGAVDFNQVSNQPLNVPLITTGTQTVGAAGTYSQIVLTRDSSTSLVTVYVNGVSDFSFTDTAGLAILGDVSGAATPNADLTLFKDDGAGLGSGIVSETSLGDIARLRLYDGALTPTQVAALDTFVVPEPGGVCVLMLCGMMILNRSPRREVQPVHA